MPGTPPHILRSIGWPSVLDLKLDNLHEPSYGLTPARVRAMVADGWEIDSHTIDHPDLTTADADRLQLEPAESRRRLQRALAGPIMPDWLRLPLQAVAIAGARAAGRA